LHLDWLLKNLHEKVRSKVSYQLSTLYTHFYNIPENTGEGTPSLTFVRKLDATDLLLATKQVSAAMRLRNMDSMVQNVISVPSYHVPGSGRVFPESEIEMGM
jgi:hypothetical protein